MHWKKILKEERVAGQAYGVCAVNNVKGVDNECVLVKLME
jgi:hypothetical protein